MVYQGEINGIPVKTGDLICTSDGDTGDIQGQLWRFIGKFIPGEVDHIVIYTGPDGWCVEAGAQLHVIKFEMSQPFWDARAMIDKRGPLLDVFHGVAYPFARKNLPMEEEDRLREKVAAYCLDQAKQNKPYNVNFFDSSTDKAFYCSQLAYKAYLEVGIDLNTGQGVPHLPGTGSIIFPQEIWSGCDHRS
ncbi:MAG TPA: hypothetical protein PLI09_03025 [Candidatus Hydrogenedentes bacterium]|nr:hypothetical protein [Candidatus Hydrogenedentota bacterium]